REAAPTFSLRTRLVDVQSPSVQFRAIERSDCLIRLGGVAHFDKRKPTGATCVTIRHQIYSIHGAITFKQGTDARFGRAESKVANKNVFQNHSPLFLIEQLNEAGFDAARLLRDDQKDALSIAGMDSSIRPRGTTSFGLAERFIVVAPQRSTGRCDEF